MKNKFALVVLFVFTALSISAQQLYIPRSFQNALNEGTRSLDGKPGPKYWQNTADYNIKITTAPPDRTIRGTEEITYYNKSPKPIANPVFRLTMNIHRPGAAREFPASKDYLTDGVIIDEYAENGKVKPWRDTSGSFQRVKLDKALNPGESVKFTFKWHYDMSVESGREGAIDATTFFMAYFYPRVAVLDDIDGWDTTQFTEGHEFYNDFNNYVFEVSVPKNFVVWATGDLQNADEVLQPEIAARHKKSLTSDEVINIATLDEIKAGKVTAQKDTLTWKWKANNISDVTIAVSDHYIWDGSSVVVDPATGRRAAAQAAYNVEAKDFTKMVEYVKHALDYGSTKWPGVPYGFSKLTAVRGFADMEYPMMINDSSFPEPEFTRFVAEHEIFHQWFPFYMGINEQRYGFMDEGWATALEHLVGIDDLGKEKAIGFFQQFRVQSWANDPSAEGDISIITPGDALTGGAVGNNQYGKPALGYLALKDMLGDDVFKKGLHEFMRRWNGKHPTPWDMFASFNAGTGQNLNWFFNRWYFSNNYIDMAIASAVPGKGGYRVTLKNIGGYPAPVDIVAEYTDGTKETFHQTPAIWSKNPATATVSIAAKKKVKSISLNGGIFMDANGKDNKWGS